MQKVGQKYKACPTIRQTAVFFREFRMFLNGSGYFCRTTDNRELITNNGEHGIFAHIARFI
jgi:hypothetical protein